MTSVASHSPSNQSMTLLSKLLLPPKDGAFPSSPANVELKKLVLDLNREGFDDLLALAQSHHVIVRGLVGMQNLMREARDLERAKWAESALETEKARIENALIFLHNICGVFEDQGHEVTVIKSLDHWPDLGSDLDLYTDANEEAVIQLMKSRFGAQVASQSWGDRLAHKWNFNVSGLPEAVEVHIGHLGQTGEQAYIASALINRSKLALVSDLGFHVPSNSDRIMISTLQRMYRHFYFRLCDVVDTTALSDAGGIDFVNLCYLARRAGIWEGVATYLTIVSDYVQTYRGTGLDLPKFITSSARFRGNKAYYSRGFLRVPIVPQSVRLYGSQLARILARGELHNSARLTLLPWLATAALIGQKLTGSDKGIW